MKNQILIGVAFLVVLVVGAAVIHYEAEQTRTAIRESTAGAVTDRVGQSIDRVTSPERVGAAVEKIEGVLKEVQTNSMKTLPELSKPAAEVTKEVAGELRGVVTDVFGLGAPTTDSKSGSPSSQAETTRSTVGGIFDGIRSTIEPPRDGETSSSSKTEKAPPSKSDESADGKKANDDQDGNDEKKSGEKKNGDEKSGDDENKGSSKKDDDHSSKEQSGRQDDKKPKTVALIDRLFDLAEKTTEKGDKIARNMVRLSIEDEKRWGKRLHEEVTVGSKIVRDPAVTQRVCRAAAPLLKTLLRPEIEYTFTVLQSDNDDLNAFSLPGGYVYVHSALMDFFENDDELQFVLAHEIGHVDLEHCVNKLTYSARVSDWTAPVLGQVAGVLHDLLSRSYTKNDEFDADHYAFAAVIAAGQTRERALSFPRRFGKHERDHEPEAAKKPAERSLPSLVVERTENHFHTHPPMDERLKRLEAIDADAIRAKAASARRDTVK